MTGPAVARGSRRIRQAGSGRSEREGDAGYGIAGTEQAGVERGRGGVGRSVRTERELGRRSGPRLSDALGWATGESWVAG